MNKLKSKCCGAEAYSLYVQSETPPFIFEVLFCTKCHKPCELIDKNKPQDTALYAALRR